MQFRWLLTFALLAASASSASAQTAPRERVVAGLARYDVGPGGETLSALQEAGAIAGRGDLEMRAMRAIAAAQVLAASEYLDDTTLTTNLAAALGVSRDEVRSHLEAELDAIRGPQRRGALEARAALDALRSFAQDPGSAARGQGLMRDALVVRSVSREDAAPLMADECPRPRPTFPCTWDAPSRRHALSVLEARRAVVRIQRAAAQGDPLAALLRAEVEASAARLDARVIRPMEPLPASIAHFRSGQPQSFEALVIVEADGFVVRPVRAIAFTADGPTPSAETATVRIPSEREYPPVPQALPPLVEAIRALGLAEGATIGLAIAGEVPFDRVVRVLLSLGRAERAATHFVGHSDDGGIVAIPLRTARVAELGPGDARLRVRPSGIAVGRGPGGREQLVPRTRGTGGLTHNETGVRDRLARMQPRALAIDGSTAPAAVVLGLASGAPTGGVIVLVP